MLLSTVVKESGGMLMRAEIHQDDNGYSIQYHGPNGHIKTESFSGNSLAYVEEAAENWVAGIKVLNG